MVASSPLTAMLARTLIDRVTLGSSGTHCRSAETDTGPSERVGSAASAAREVDGAGLAEVACSLTVLNARTPLDRETSEAGDLPSVECDAVVTGP